MVRDLKADLELCQRATPGPWFAYRTASGQVTVQCPPGWICTMSDKGDMPTARFIAAAREGWPEAIRRAMVAEQGMEEAEARLVADELEALGFLWQEYVQADPATLTEDAKDLAERVRQKVRELAGVEGLEAERDGLKARLTEVEAQAAQMREALEEALPADESGWWCPTCKYEVPDVEVTFEGYHDACGTYIEIVNSGAWRERSRAAVASDAGRETTERLEQLEAQVVAMRQALAEAIRGLELVHPMDLAEPCAVYEVWQQCKAALSSNAGRETARRLRLLEELVEAATAFVERCTLVECLPQTEDAICDEDPCLKERLKVLVRVLKGGNDDAGTGS